MTYVVRLMSFLIPGTARGTIEGSAQTNPGYCTGWLLAVGLSCTPFGIQTRGERNPYGQVGDDPCPH